MSQEVKYGFISDAHEDPGIVMRAVSVLNGLEVNRLVLNGDIGQNRGTPERTMAAMAFIIEQAAKSGLETFVQPGSHETVGFYQPVIEHFAEKYPNIIDTLKHRKHEKEGHHLVFLPGSDFVCGGEYQIGDSPNLPTGSYMQINSTPNLIILNNLAEAQGYINQLGPKDRYALMNFSNMNDLKKEITSPEKTIVICHVPRRFNLSNAVDMAEFGLVEKDFVLDGENIPKDSIFKIEFAKELSKRGLPVELRRENRGNNDLAQLYHEIGVRKAVSGHFHEASHKAHDVRCNNVPQNTFVNELFWNSGHMDKGHCGILTVRGEEVSYQNVDLNDYK